MGGDFNVVYRDDIIYKDIVYFAGKVVDKRYGLRFESFSTRGLADLASRISEILDGRYTNFREQEIILHNGRVIIRTGLNFRELECLSETLSSSPELVKNFE